MLKRALDFFLFSKIYVSISVALLSAVSFIVYDKPINFNVIGFTYFSTLTLYAFHQVWGLDSIGLKSTSVRQKWALNNKWTLVWIAIGASFCAAGFAFALHVKSLNLLVPLGIISVGYTAPIFTKRLRDIPSIKIYLISVVVAGIVVVLPGVESGVSSDEIASLFAVQTLFLFGVTIPFDIRDMAVDKTELKTIPMLLGEQKAKFLAITILAFNSLFALYLLPNGLPFLISAILAMIIVWFTNSQRSEYYFALLVEGMMIAQFAFLVFYVN